MTRTEVIQVLTALADGVDPTSGRPLWPESIFHTPKVIRALFAAKQLLRTKARHNESPIPPRAGQPWDADEDAKLVLAFEDGINLAIIAQRHGRTRDAILSRLIHLGKPVAFRETSRIQRRGLEESAEPPHRAKTRANAGRVWTQAEDEQLLRMFDDGFALEEIASQLGRGVHGVDVRLYKLGKLPIEDQREEPIPS